MYNEQESDFEGIVRLTGNSHVVTIPKETITKLNLAPNQGISIHIRKWSVKE